MTTITQEQLTTELDMEVFVWQTLDPEHGWHVLVVQDDTGSINSVLGDDEDQMRELAGSISALVFEDQTEVQYLGRDDPDGRAGRPTAVRLLRVSGSRGNKVIGFITPDASWTEVGDE